MALVTKQYLYETIASLLEGGSPSAGKKFEPRMIQAYIQQAINRKLKTEYLSVTLPTDETIPDGLVLACYDNVPVIPYKTVLSRAKLPAMPVSLRRQMGVYFVGPATDGNLTPANLVGGIVTIEAETDISISITGTSAVVTGITAGSSVIFCDALRNREVNVIRGNLPIAGPGIVPSDGSNYFTKVLSSGTIYLKGFVNQDSPLAYNEYIKIQTVL